MREGWKEVKIGDLGKVITGNTPPKNDPANYGDEYPFIKPTDMEIDQRYVKSWDENYSEKSFKRYYRSYIPPKATGVVTIGTVGEKIFQADRWCFTNQSVNVVIPNGDFYDHDFVYYLLKMNLPKVENANPGTASGRHHVSKSNFCSIKVTVPKSKETQRKIATILSAYDDLIENNLRRIRLLEEKAQLTYEEWFVRMKFPGHETAVFDAETGLPVGWGRVKCFDAMHVMSGGTPKTAIEKYWNGEIEFYTPKDACDSAYTNGTEKKITQIGLEKCNSKLYPKDTVFITARGTVGKINLASKGMAMNQSCYALKGKENVTQLFLYNSINSIISSFKGAASGGVFDTIVVDTFKFLPFILPSKALIDNYTKILSPLYESCLNLQTQNQLLKEARDLLLPRLMMGMIDVETML